MQGRGDKMLCKLKYPGSFLIRLWLRLTVLSLLTTARVPFSSEFEYYNIFARPLSVLLYSVFLNHTVFSFHIKIAAYNMFTPMCKTQMERLIIISICVGHSCFGFALVFFLFQFWPVGINVLKVCHVCTDSCYSCCLAIVMARLSDVAVNYMGKCICCIADLHTIAFHFLNDTYRDSFSSILPPSSERFINPLDIASFKLHPWHEEASPTRISQILNN